MASKTNQHVFVHLHKKKSDIIQNSSRTAKIRNILSLIYRLLTTIYRYEFFSFFRYKKNSYVRGYKPRTQYDSRNR